MKTTKYEICRYIADNAGYKYVTNAYIRKVAEKQTREYLLQCLAFALRTDAECDWQYAFDCITRGIDY